MLGVKITIFACVITVLWVLGIRIYLEENPRERWKIGLEEPIWLEACAWLIVADIIGIIYSVFYMLFLR